ncbi:MAG: glycosyltransferase family 2 protein [Actinomycetota bacterium]|nr:glycosyltransferase family 2 protein [Actinomycetota bacterium]
MLQTADRSLVARGAQPQLTASGSALPESSADSSAEALPQWSIHVLVPAHDEEASIGATLASLRQQTLQPVSITVLADNCSDHTAGAAMIEGAAIYTTVENTDHRAGALDQYLRQNLLSMDPEHFILVLDADANLDPRFLETAIRRMSADRRIGAVGGVFVGNEPRTLLEQAQANEFVRFARAVARKEGRVMVLTGRATIYRVTALLQVAEQRERRLPGRMGDSYDIAALTQDNEITLALTHLGWRIVSPQECTVRTELMPTLGDLHRQRLRWYRGAIENLHTYGWTRVTSRYWVQQVGLLLCTLGFGLFVAIAAIELSLGQLRWSPLWSAVALLFLVERLVTVWRVGTPRGRLLALGLVPEIGYDVFLQATFVRAAFQVVRGVDRSHRPPPARLHRA